MAIEYYIAICNPLYHTQLCSVRTTYILISLIWFLGSIPLLPDLFILLATEPSEFFYSPIICNRDFVLLHPYLVEKKNISHLVYLSFAWLTFVYTYFRLIFAAKASGSHAMKARNTIILHGLQLLFCMFTYIHVHMGCNLSFCHVYIWTEVYKFSTQEKTEFAAVCPFL